MKHLFIKSWDYLSNNWKVWDYVERIGPFHSNNRWPHAWFLGHDNLHTDFYLEIEKRNGKDIP